MINTNKKLMEETNFTELEKTTNRRRHLLPWWIKFFCWAFMVTGILTIIVFVLSLFGIQEDLGLYGFDVVKGKIMNNFLVFFSFLFNGIVAYFLWFEKKNAVLLGITSSIWGILVCLLSMLLGVFVYNSGISFRLEIVLLVIFLIKLVKIKPLWIKNS
jgi:hypothetical protein